MKGEVQEINSQIKVQKELPPAFLLQGKMMNILVFVFVLECKIERGRRFRKGAHTQSR